MEEKGAPSRGGRWLTVVLLVCFVLWNTPCGWDWYYLEDDISINGVKKVHVVFMNHLDVGYTGYINDVNNEYFHKYFPLAQKLSTELRNNKTSKDRYVYTTHPWLLSFFYDCPCPHDPDCIFLSLNNNRTKPLLCPTDAEKNALTAAIKRGDIVWNGVPFNFQAENMSPELFEGSLKSVRDLDYAFGANTKTVSIRDVIYVTRGVVPLLNKYGFNALTIGSNMANFPPQVPKLHVWKDQASGTDVIVIHHPYGYGGIGRSTCAGPGRCGDCAESPNGIALCTQFRSDNMGPSATKEEIYATFQAVREQYPGAEVVGSTFDAFVKEVMPVKHLLPVVDKEVGDTWIYGVPSDPLKMAQNREIQRVWLECYKSGNELCSMEDPSIKNMWRYLWKIPEHTWGLPEIHGFHIHDYLKSNLQSSLANDNYLRSAMSWSEQRVYNELALLALEADNHPIAKTARRRVEAITHVVEPDVSGLNKHKANTGMVELDAVKVEVGSAGELKSVEDQHKKWELSVGGFSYNTYNDSDFVLFNKQYINSGKVNGQFSKVGSNVYSESTRWSPTVTSIHTHHNTIILRLQMPNKAYTMYGSPTHLWANYTFIEQTDGGLKIQYHLCWFNKSATLVGESSSVGFTPTQVQSKWSIDKLGTAVDPENVLNGGNQMNHASWRGVAVDTRQGVFAVDSLDAAVYMPQTKQLKDGTPFPAHSIGLQTLPKGSVTGFSVNLHNNLWNTNYPLWYPYYDKRYCMTPNNCRDKDMRFRFNIML